MKIQLHYLQSAFNIPGKIQHHQNIESDSGDLMIHCSILNHGQQYSYIFHRVNSPMLTDPKATLYNTGRITRHINWKLIRDKGATNTFFPTLLHTKGGFFHFSNEDHETWQCLDLRSQVRPIGSINNTEQTFTLASAYGEFINQLSDMHPSTMLTPISRFRNGHYHIKEMINAVETDKQRRVYDAQDEIRFIFQCRDFCKHIDNEKLNHTIVPRVIHQDASLKNLFEHTDSDNTYSIGGLDYAMVGLPLYDFGSIVYHVINSQKRSSKKSHYYHHISAATRGFISGCSCLTDPEIYSLALGPKAYVIDLAAKYLTDYLCDRSMYSVLTSSQKLSKVKELIYFANQLDTYKEHLSQLVGTATNLLHKQQRYMPAQ